MKLILTCFRTSASFSAILFILFGRTNTKISCACDPRQARGAYWENFALARSQGLLYSFPGIVWKCRGQRAQLIC